MIDELVLTVIARDRRTLHRTRPFVEALLVVEQAIELQLSEGVPDEIRHWASEQVYAAIRNLCLLTGSERSLVPVAAKSALTSAGAIGGVLGSPMPPGDDRHVDFRHVAKAQQMHLML